VGMSERRTHIIKTSLNYYNNLLIRLSELQSPMPEVVKTDLANEHVKVLEVIKIVETHGLKEKVWEQLRVLETPHYARYVCAALQCYLHDLEPLVSEMTTELNNFMEFELVNRDIELARQAIKNIGCVI
jgi:hypothetical protein